MSAQEHSRLAVWNASQHPYRHVLSEFAYSNARFPGALDAQSAIDYLFNVIYPRYRTTVANHAALLALAAPVENDYVIVTDDGGGTIVGYVYQTLDGTGAWRKRYDTAWSLDGILAETQVRTQYLYVSKYGTSDHDAAGADVVGTYAGQTIYGGDKTNQNLTLNANSKDTTGFVQTDNILRPTADNTLDLGTAALRWQTIRAGTSVIAGTLTASSGSLSDSSGSLTFGATNLVTTGTLGSGALTATSGLISGFSLTTGAGPTRGLLSHSSAAIDFGANTLTTTGIITGGINSKLADITFANGSVTSASPAIDFGANNLVTTGTLGAGVTTVSQLNSGNMRLTGNTLSSQNAGGNIIIAPNGAGTVDIQKAATTLGITATGSISATVTVTGTTSVVGGNLTMSGNTLSSNSGNLDIILTPNGTGAVKSSGVLYPSADATLALGKTASRWTSIFLSTGLNDGTNAVSIATLLSLRNINTGVADGMALFYNAGTGTWLPSAPDTEITHSGLTGLVTGDAGHTQFAMLAGRAGGQTLQGGAAASEILTLESTANVTKGSIQFKDKLMPATDNAVDIGDSTHTVRNLYTKGQAINLRVENLTSGTLPTPGADTTGRIFWTTDTHRLYIDDGSALEIASVGRFVGDTVWAAALTKTVTVSASIIDARNAIWQVHDTADNSVMNCTITAISATQVKIDVDNAFTGTTRLIGLE